MSAQKTNYVCTHRGRPQREKPAAAVGAWHDNDAEALDPRVVQIMLLQKLRNEEIEVNDLSTAPEERTRDKAERRRLGATGPFAGDFESARVYWFVDGPELYWGFSEPPITIRQRLVWRCPRCRLEKRMSIKNAEKIRHAGVERVDISTLP